MNKIEVKKCVCVKLHDVNDDILTIGKVYDIVKDISICLVTNIDLSHTSFIADDGKSYLIHSDEQIDMNFISLEEWREKKLNELGI